MTNLYVACRSATYIFISKMRYKLSFIFRIQRRDFVSLVCAEVSREGEITNSLDEVFDVANILES